MNIGIIGAGFVGREVGKAAVRAGHKVMLSNSRGPKSLYTVRSGTGCDAGTVADAVAFGHIIIIATPMEVYDTFPAEALAGKLVIDANNYHPLRDGAIEALDQRETTVSEILRKHLPKSRLVKALNSIRMEGFERDARPAGAADRRAIPIAGDNAGDKLVVTQLLDDVGYDAVDVGLLSEGWRFDHGAPVYCVPLGKDDLARRLKETMPEDCKPGGVHR